MVKDMEEDFDLGEPVEDDPEDLEAIEAKPVNKAPTKGSVNSNWGVQRMPEVFRVIDPKTKKVMAEAMSIEELNLQLAILTAQYAYEAAKNTR